MSDQIFQNVTLLPKFCFLCLCSGPHSTYLLFCNLKCFCCFNLKTHGTQDSQHAPKTSPLWFQCCTKMKHFLHWTKSRQHLPFLIAFEDKLVVYKLNFMEAPLKNSHSGTCGEDKLSKKCLVDISIAMIHPLASCCCELISVKCFSSPSAQYFCLQWQCPVKRSDRDNMQHLPWCFSYAATFTSANQSVTSVRC